MSYNPSDLRLPAWLIRLLDALVRIQLPLAPNWRLRLTRPGSMFAAALLGVWLAAFYSGNNLLYLCGAVLTLLMSASMMQTASLLKQFPAFTLPAMYAGESCVVRSELDQVLKPAAMADISWRNRMGHFSLTARCSDQHVLLSGSLSPKQRGIYAMEQLCLASSAPLGLFELQKQGRSDANMLVLPQPVAWSMQSLGQGSEEQLSLRQGDEWQDLRAYVSGDLLSRVHWRKATSTSSDWLVKRFNSVDARQNQQGLLRVDLHLPQGSSRDDFEALLGKACFWMMQPQAETLILGRKRFELSNQEQYRQAQRALAMIKPAAVAASGSGGLLLSLVQS